MQESIRSGDDCGAAVASDIAVGGGDGATRLFVILAVLCFAPSGLFFFLQPRGVVSSFAPGTLLAALVIVGVVATVGTSAMTTTRVANYASFIGLLFAAILVHLVGANALGSGTEPARALQSLPVLFLMMAGAIALAALLRQDAGGLNRAVAMIRWLLIGLTLLSVVGIQLFPVGWEKPIFPFSEPSHMALVLNPFLLHACVTSRGTKRLLWVGGGFVLAFAAASLTLMLGMGVAALICLPLIGVVAVGTAVAGTAALVDISYFTDRLDFNEGSQNLSNLVFRQGWELVWDAMARTSGWGVGFQQLGYAPFRSPSADVLYSILRDDANTRDGGFLLAKVVSEFGVVGWLLMLAYFGVAARCAWQLRRGTLARAVEAPASVVFAWCVVCSFVTEVLARDVGYFAGSVLLFLAALYVLWEHRSVRDIQPAVALPDGAGWHG